MFSVLSCILFVIKFCVFINCTGVGVSNFAKNLGVCPAACSVNVQVSSTSRRKPAVTHSSDTVRMSSVPVSCKFTGRAAVGASIHVRRACLLVLRK